MKRILIEFKKELPKERAEKLLRDLQAQCEEDEHGESYGQFIIETEDKDFSIETWADFRSISFVI